MLTAGKFLQHCAKLVDPSITPENRKELATEVRDSIELVHSQEYSSFLAHFLPAFKTVLTVLTKPQQIDNTIHQTRAVILEILHRLPQNETLRTKFVEVFALAMDILRTDNEENAITAIHIIFDLHKTYRHHLGRQVEPFLDFVRQLYESFPNTVKALLLTKKPPETPGQPTVRRMTTSSQSFKVMTESPLLVMFVFQLYPVYIKTHAPRLVPLMTQAIEVDLPAYAVAAAPKAALVEFVTAQIKTLSFLAYLLRKHREWIKTDDASLARSVVKLFQSCPADSVSIRKDLLVASRHMLQTFHHGFSGQLDLLLDAKVLLGTGRGAVALRPLAYMFLAEVIHRIRLHLSVSQKERIISIFSTNLHDPTFSYGIQISAVRLLLNLIDGMSKGDTDDANRSIGARELLLRILRTMVDKYKTLGDQVPRLSKSVEELRSRPNPVESGERLCEAMVGDPMKEIDEFKSLLKTLTHGLKTVIWAAINTGVSDTSVAKNSPPGQSEPPSNPESQFGSSPSASTSRKRVRAGLLERECETIAQLLEAGQKCFRLYSRLDERGDGLKDSNNSVSTQKSEGVDNSEDVGRAANTDPDFSFLATSPKVASSSSQEDKEIFDLFAQIFKVLDIRSFQDIFGLRMGDLFEHIVENPTALIIPQQFLANDNISKYFADILLNFLVDNLAILDMPLPQSPRDLTREERMARSLLKLFKILFASVSFFPTNEPVLRLHIGSLVRKCLELAIKAKNPHNYLLMLRALFKTLTKSKIQFELLYREFMPLVEPLLNGLLDLYEGPNRLAHSDLIVELCLMIPARPSTIFPYLDLQIKPIVWSLQGGTENVQYGLRTLEFWVDMLQPEYLERLLVRVDPDLSTSMYRLLRVSQSKGADSAGTTLRILGKLGSRARCNRSLKPTFEVGRDLRAAQEIPLHWPDKSNATLETDSLIRLSVDGLLNKRTNTSFSESNEYKTEAWMFLYSCLCPFIGLTHSNSQLPANSLKFPAFGIWSICGSSDFNGARRTAGPSAVSQNAKQRLASEKSMVKDLLIALIGAAEVVQIEKLTGNDNRRRSDAFPSAEVCVGDMCRYFALLTVQKLERNATSPRSSRIARMQVSSECHDDDIMGHEVFLDAITAAMSLEDRLFSQSGLKSLKAYLSALFDYCISKPESSRNAAEGQNPGKGHSKILSEEGQEDLRRETVRNTPAESARPQAASSAHGVAHPLTSSLKPVGRTGNEAAPSKGPQSHLTGAADAKADVEMSDAKSGPGVERMEIVENRKGLVDEHVLALSLVPVVDRLCHCCYQKNWSDKWAGAYGLGVVVDVIEDGMFSSSYFARNIIYMIRALMFVIREGSSAIEYAIIEYGRKILRTLLETCFSRGQTTNPPDRLLPSELPKIFREATVRLTIDLSSDSPNARETARQCLRVLGKTLNREVSDILSHDSCKEQLLRPLIQRSVRQQPFPLQIGHMEAMIFCLQLERAPLREELFSSPLRNIFLREVIAISEDPTFEKLTEAEEGIRSRLVENKMVDPKAVRHLLLLRQKAVELLCCVVVNCSKSLLEPINDALFRSIISSLFKKLQSRDKKIIESAKRGLKQAIADHPKPKDLLQRNLRPILSNLADYQRLTMQYVEGLSRVLELFSHWFNVNLGEKLLEHLHRWLEPENLVHLKRWAPGTEARVGAAVLNLFHLLPTTASKFLEQIVRMVIQLESVLAVAGPGVAHLGLKSAKAASTSPYREPLLKYCNQHAVVAAKFFLQNLEAEPKRQLFFVMLRSTESLPLRKELMDNPKRLVSPSLLSVEGMGTKSLHSITLIDLLSRHDPGWLGRDSDLIAKLSSYWKTVSSFTSVNESTPPSLGQVQEVQTLAGIFIRYCSHFEKEVGMLFGLLTVFSARTTCDFTFVKDFLHSKVTQLSFAESRSAIMVHLFSLFQDKTVPQDRKVHAMQYIVIPMLEYHLEERKRQTEKRAISSKGKSEDGQTNGDISVSAKQVSSNKTSENKASCDSGNRKGLSSHKGDNLSQSTTSELKEKEQSAGRDAIAHVPAETVLNASMIQRIMVELLDQPDEILRGYNEPLSAELLRLATLLIRYMPVELGRYRRELIKFGWNHLKREDSIAKQCAFVNVSQFFEAYPAPERIILQVFVALLRACQGDGKELVQEALDILTPALPRRLEHNPADHKYPMWIRYTKKILLEEGHSVPNLVHIWHLIARHASLFYVARAQFVPIMVNSLSRIGLNASTSSENRRLTLDLVDLIVRWEQTRRRELKRNTSQGKLADSQPSGLGESRKRAREEGIARNASMEDPSRASDKAQHHVGEPPAKMRKAEGSQPIPESAPSIKHVPSSTSRDPEDFKPTSAMTDVLIQFLVQIPFRGLDRREYSLVTKRCVILLKQASELWPGSIAKLGFLGKLLELPNGEKASTQVQQDSKKASSQGSHAAGNQSTESKTTLKGDSPQVDKAETNRGRRPGARQVALSTALGIVKILIKCQGRSFVKGNVSSIRELVLPAIGEGDVRMAMLFASLLRELVLLWPPVSSVPLNVDMNKQKAKPTKAQVLKSMTKAENSLPSLKSSESEKTSLKEDEQNAKSPSPSEDSDMKHMYTFVHDAIERSLRSSDIDAQQCALQVLKVFSDEAPQECVKYQEMLVKGLQRVAREHLSSSQQMGPSNPGPTPSAGIGNRGNGGKDRGSVNVPTQSYGKTGNGSEQVLSDFGRRGKPQANEETLPRRTRETQTLILYLALVGDNIITLEPPQKKATMQWVIALIEKCMDVDVLLEVVRIAKNWIAWKPRKETPLSLHKEALSAKEKVQLLGKMGAFERFISNGSDDLMKSYLSIVLGIFSGRERRPELLPRLERAFMLGMKSPERSTRQKFFQIYNDAIAPSLSTRLQFLLAKQEWEHLSDSFWIKHGAEVLISAAEKNRSLIGSRYSSTLPIAKCAENETETNSAAAEAISQGRRGKVQLQGSMVILDPALLRFHRVQKSIRIYDIVNSLQSLLHYDTEFAHQVWVDIFPKAWALLNSSERAVMERSLPVLLSKEYHILQATWPRNTMQSMLDGLVKCSPIPQIRADLVFHLGSRWNAWHSALRFLELQEDHWRGKLPSTHVGTEDKLNNRIRAELEDIADARAELYRLLHERDYFAGSWKVRSKSPLTKKALVLEQVAKYSQAQSVYGTAMGLQLSTGSGFSFRDDRGALIPDRPGKAEVCLWEERWIDCARKLCQWEVLTEFARVVVNTELLHECLWRIPDWSALKELLIKNPVEEGPQLKLYQAYMQLQENNLEVADSYIQAGYEKSLKRYCALPESWDLDAYGPIFVQFQQLVELQESRRILSELNALSRHGNTTINVEQKIDHVRLILNTWRERLPLQHEPLTTWNDILTWRNHVHAVVVNVLEALKEAASAKVAAAQGGPGNSGVANRNGNALTSQTPQVQAAAAIAQALPQQVLVMGVNETAWSVHRFAKACRKQGFPEMALYALQKLYPFGTMELTEYFVKTMETAKSFMAQPVGIEKSTEYGLHELNKCNMDHFNARQKSQLFTVRGKLCAALGKEEGAVDAFTVALSTSSDVSSAWLAWGQHCDKKQERLFLEVSFTPKSDVRQSAESGSDSFLAREAALEWREATVNCYLQAVRFGSRKSRLYLPRVLRLLTVDVHNRFQIASQARNTGAEENDSSRATSLKASASTLSGNKTAAQGLNTSSHGKANSVSSALSNNWGTAVQVSLKEGVARVITGLLSEIPSWMWIPWIPQLVSMLCRREANVVRPLLVRVAQQYPQAAFFPVRAFMEDRKQIDKPEKVLYKEALKIGRPNTSALLPHAPSAQGNAVRQIQVAKEHVQKAQQRYQILQNALQRTDAAISATQGTAHQSGHMAKKAQLNEELVNTRQLLEKCVREYAAAQQRQRQALERPSPGSGDTGADMAGTKNQNENSSRVQPVNAKTEGPTASSASGPSKDNSGSDLLPRKQESREEGDSKKAHANPNAGDRIVATSAVPRTPFAHADYVMARIVKSHQLIYVEVESIALELAYRLKPQKEEHLLSLMNALLHRCYQYPVKMGKEVASSFRSALEEVSRMCFQTGEENREKFSEQGAHTGISGLKEAFEAELAPQTAKDFPTEIEPFIARLRRWQGIFQRRVRAMPDYLNLESASKHLLEISYSDVEVFGQYIDVDIAEPDITRHVTIERFSADVRVVRRHSGPSRGIRVVGTDGKVYDFLLEASINASIQSTEDRTAQVFRLLNTAVFAKDSEAHRRRIQLTVPTFVVIGARSRLVSDDPRLSSLSDGLEQYLEMDGKRIDDPLMAFRTLASEAYNRRRPNAAKETSRAETIAARVDAYHAVCKSHVPDSCFSEWVRSRMPTATCDFNFRKRFSETLGATSVVYYSMAIGARRPQNILFSWSSGTIHNVHMRGLISGRGILESDEAVPFRLTRNLQGAMGRFGLEGPFYGSMLVTLECMAQKFGIIRLFLDLILRDELSGWLSNKSEAGRSRTESGGVAGKEESEFKVLEDCVSTSVKAIASRLKCQQGWQIGHAGAGQKNVEEMAEYVSSLIGKASKPENLAQMESSWQAWY